MRNRTIELAAVEKFIVLLAVATSPIAGRAAHGDVSKNATNQTSISIEVPQLFRIANVEDITIDDRAGVAVAIANGAAYTSIAYGVCIWTNDPSYQTGRLKFTSINGALREPLPNVFRMKTSSANFIAYEILFESTPNQWAPTDQGNQPESSTGYSQEIAQGNGAKSFQRGASSDCGGPGQHNRSMKIKISAADLLKLQPDTSYNDTLTLSLSGL